MEEIRKEALENEAAEPAVVEETAEKTAGSRLEKPKKKRKYCRQLSMRIHRTERRTFSRF